jgi:hypothetical protein
MTPFLKYKTERGKRYALLPSQIRGLESLGSATRIYASVAGMPISFSVRRPYEEIERELEQARGDAEYSEG